MSAMRGSKQLTQPSPSVVATIAPISEAVVVTRSGLLKGVTQGDKLNYFLVLSGGEAVKLEVPESIELAKFENLKVLITGKYNESLNILKLEKISEFEKTSTVF